MIQQWCHTLIPEVQFCLSETRLTTHTGTYSFLKSTKVNQSPPNHDTFSSFTKSGDPTLQQEKFPLCPFIFARMAIYLCSQTFSTIYTQSTADISLCQHLSLISWPVNMSPPQAELNSLSIFPGWEFTWQVDTLLHRARLSPVRIFPCE